MKARFSGVSAAQRALNPKGKCYNLGLCHKAIKFIGYTEIFLFRHRGICRILSVISSLFRASSRWH